MHFTLGAFAIRLQWLFCVCVHVWGGGGGGGPVLYVYVENRVPLGFLWHFQHMGCVGFIQNALSISSGDIH